MRGLLLAIYLALMLQTEPVKNAQHTELSRNLSAMAVDSTLKLRNATRARPGPSAACPMPSYAVLVFVVTAVIAYLVGKRKGGLDSKQSQVLCSRMHAIGSVSTDLVFSFGSNSAGCRGKRTYPAQRRKSRPDSS